MLRRQSNIEDVIVVKATAETAGRETNTYDFLANSECAIFREGGTIATATTAAADVAAGRTKFTIGYKDSNGVFQTSDVIDATTVSNYVGKKSVAVAEQVTYIGYNGSANSIIAANSNTYSISLWFTNDTISGFMDQLIKYGFYKSDSTGAQFEIASGLALSLYNNLKNELEYRVKVERVCSGVQTAVPTAADNFTFTTGSKYFTATDIDDATGTAALVVGDAIVIGTAATSPVYRITAIDAVTNIGTLDVPFAGTTATIADGSLKVIVKALAEAADWGLKLTGVAKTWVLGSYPFGKVKWTTELDGFGATIVTESVAATVGVGAYETVSEAEWFAQGNEGGTSRYRVRGDAPAYVPRKETVSGTYYSTLSFKHYHTMQSEIGPLNNSPKAVVVFLAAPSVTAAANATSVTDADTGVKVVLDAYMVAAGTGAAQTGNV